MRPFFRSSPSFVRAARQFSTHNWGENVKFSNKEFKTPEDVTELQEIVAKADSLRVLGSGHSFSPICDTEGTLVSLAFMRNILDFDVEEMTLTVEGGTTLGDVYRYLSPRGAALKNLPSLPHITVAGALATGTHGSGLTPGLEADFASLCREVEFVLPDGALRAYRRGVDPEFEAALVHAGLLGVVSRVVLDMVPAFDVSQRVLVGWDHDRAIAGYERIARGPDSSTISFNFGSGGCIAWLRYFHADEETHGATGSAPPELEAAAEASGLGGSLLTGPYNKVHEMGPGSSINTSYTGAWNDALSLYMEDGVELGMPHLCTQAEYHFPLAMASEALAAVKRTASQWPAWLGTDYDTDKFCDGPLVLHCGTRTVAASAHRGLDPFVGHDSVTLHVTFTSSRNPLYTHSVSRCLDELEETLRPFGARPHWGKMFNFTTQQVADVFPPEHLAEFAALARSHDPSGKFHNDLVTKQILEL